MKRKRQFTARVLALLLAAVLLGGTVPLGITAADTIAVSPTALTTIVLANACEAFGISTAARGNCMWRPHWETPILTASARAIALI